MSHKIEVILQRVRKYQQPVWQYQSLKILNPYLLSSMGYVPLDSDTIQCSICLKEVKISEENQEDVSKLQKELQTHDQNCIYQNESGSLIDQEQLYLCMEEISTQLNQRSTAERYPLLNSESIWKYTQKDHFMLKKVMNLYQIETQKINISFFLKLFGWYFLKNEDNQDCLTCYFCGRSLNVSQFKTVQDILQDPEEEKQTSQEKLFDPIHEHRYFCMWAGHNQNWLVLLQDLQDKFSEYLSFRLKVQPLSTKKMKIHIDKYLQNFNQKIQGSILKLKQVGEEFNKLCSYLEQQKNAQLSVENMQSDMKRIRDLEQEMEQSQETIKNNLHPAKKIKLI